MKKRIICMDESGKFESKETHARFLGGCVFTGNLSREEKNLTDMFTALAEEITQEHRQAFRGCEFRFPYSFHMSKLTVFDAGNQGVVISDDDTLRKLKGKIRDRVKEYLSGRKDEYQLYALVVPFQNTFGYEGDKETSGFSLTDFRNPGVLYERLVTGLVHNFTFYSLDSDVEKNIFKIATRMPTLPKSELTQEQLQRLRDVNRVRIDKEKDLVHLTQTNINTFRASLSEKIFERGAINRLAVNDIEIDCQSINYSGDGNTQLSPFFYLSDILCSYLLSLFYGRGNHHYENFQMNTETLKRAKEACVLPCFFWAYEETDSFFKRAVESYAAGKLAECFSALYDMEHTDGTCAGYYREYWEKKLLCALQDEYGKTENKDYLKRIPEELAYVEQLMKKGNSEYQKAEFILKELENIISNGKYRLRREEEYQIQDMYLRMHNHHGSVENSKKYFRKLLSLSDAVSMETFTDSVNRAAQIYFNQFAYEPLTELYGYLLEEAGAMKESCRNQRKMTDDLIELFFGEKPEENKKGNRLEWMGKMYSSLGQAYAYQGNYEEAERNFLMAVEEFSSEGNKGITKGYLLHTFIEAGLKEKFRELAKEVLGAEGAWEQLNHILKSKGGITGNARFHLYIWVKAVYLFGIYQSGNGKKAVKKLVELAESDRKRAEENKERHSVYWQHPWELINKYLYLLCRDSQEESLKEKAAFFMEQCRTEWPGEEETIRVIKAFIMYQIEAEPEKKLPFMEKIEGMSDSIEGLKGLSEAEDKEMYLKNKLTYMYR